MFPKVRGRARFVVLLVASLLVLLVILFKLLAASNLQEEAKSDLAVECPPKDAKPEVVDFAHASSSLMTSEEIRYIRYGDGQSAVAEDDPRYLNYIRSFVTRPADHLPRALKDTTGKKDFSQVKNTFSDIYIAKSK